MSIRPVRGVSVVVLGALAALGQAPFELPLVMVAAMAFAIYLTYPAQTARGAGLSGFAFGFGYFAVTLHWIISPFMVDAARHGWMAPFAVVLMASGGALFWAVAFWAARRMSPGLWALVPSWGAVELLRAYVFTGFPWGSPAQAMVSSTPGQLLAWIGPHGVTLVVIAAATGVVALARFTWSVRLGLLAPLVLVILVPPIADPAVLSDHTLRLVQPNAPQHEKWDPDKIDIFYARQLRLTAAPAQGKTPDAIIWPETAIPWNLNYSGVILEEISQAARGTPVILGAQRSEGGRYFNALVVLGPRGAVTQIYDKHHLVPFGEYVPLGDFAARFGIYGMAPQHGAGFSAGPGAQLMDLGPLGKALPLICYEAVFAHDVNASPLRPDFIIHATNDAWFGTYAGPQQHLAQARMRAIEQGLPVARAANTGISAMIDPHGRLLHSIKMGQAGFVDAALPLPLAPTLYSRTGDGPVVIALLLMLGIGVLRSLLRQRSVTQ